MRWYKGEMEDGTDSFARPIAPANHFPNLRVIICVVSMNACKCFSVSWSVISTCISVMFCRDDCMLDKQYIILAKHIRGITYTLILGEN